MSDEKRGVERLEQSATVNENRKPHPETERVRQVLREFGLLRDKETNNGEKGNELLQ